MSDFSNLSHPITYRAQREMRLKRRALVADLMLKRISIAQIAEQAGCSILTVRKDIRAIRAQWSSELNPEDKNRWRLQQLMKLDQLEGDLEDILRPGDEVQVSTRARLKAAEVMLKLFAQRTELLGLKQMADGEAEALAKQTQNTFNTLVVVEHRDSPRELPPMLKLLDPELSPEVLEGIYVDST